MIFVPIGIISKDGFQPRLKVADFSDDRYDGVQLRKSESNKIVIIMKSKQPTPMEWKVVYGNSEVFFKTLEDAVEFCKERGMKLVEGEE